MKLGPHTRHKHPAFTLVELLIVVTIIAILVALLTAGIFGFIGMGNEVRNQSEINQLSIAVQNFKNKYGGNPPSLLYLSNNLADYTNPIPTDPVNGWPTFLSTGIQRKNLVDESSGYITRFWPRIGWIGINWSGTGGGPWVLYGDQCLVFFLGGIPMAGVFPVPA